MQPPIVITGMHRSGTSFTASLLQAAGVHIGERLLGPSAGNELGHFENADFVDFHRRQLVLRGYDQAGWIVPADIELDEAARAEGVSLVARNARDTTWAWKDPRASFFLNFWLGVTPDARFIIVYREPAEVIRSLIRRGDAIMQYSPEVAAHAWAAHNKTLLAFARAHRSVCVVASARTISANPKAFLNLVAVRFEAALQIDSESTFRAEHFHLEPEGSPLPLLVRHFVPECAEVFDELQSEADLPGNDASDALHTPEQAFFAYWRGAEQRKT